MHDITGLVEKVNDLSVDGIFANDNKILKLSLPILTPLTFTMLPGLALSSAGSNWAFQSSLIPKS